ncbi:MAG TPA: TonB-dependent receptor [Pyrinomonadaceae bacterium]|nr:TonB-dependent receptor [Pyrinomonadaceae bacterium]
MSTADLTGTVVDQNDAAVPGATVTARSLATGLVRSVTAGPDGSYTFIGLPPGNYELTAESPNFKKITISPVRLTVGQSAELKIKLEVGAPDVVVNVSGENIELIETSKSSVANTISTEQIQNLPINERSATGFALTLSTVNRDNGRPIGPAPTSGLNIGGQRGRSTQVNVDGADFTDNSINAARSTVGQEAVQEYQVSTNSYMPEFGRATGGIVNIVTKRGTNDFRGNIFGFLRDKTIQARNAFAPAGPKPDFTRGQYGATLGGPIIKDRTFFFFSFEGRQRRESGFFTTNVAQGLTGSITLPPALGGQTYNYLTPAQVAYANALLSVSPPTAVAYLTLASSGGYTALTGTNPLISPGGFGVPAGQVIGPRFLLSGTPVPTSTVNSAGDPIAFRPLFSLQPVFPITDKTHYFSIRADHALNSSNQLTMRFGYNPSKITGIQVESQNQSLGQNDFSRTGITDTKDTSFSAGLNSTLSPTVLNEFRFSYGRRKTSFRSQNNDAVAFNITDTAFIGRELFSPVDRTETRYQFANNLNIVAGSHTLKFGADFNFVEIPRALFELNFAGLFNFGEFASTNIAAFPTIGSLTPPPFTPVQSYGLGLPSIYIQGFGNPISKIKNKPIAFFAQDSWKLHPRFTLNYGVRYDVELTETIAPTPFRDPLTGISLSSNDILAAQDAVGVQQGFPRDTNNWAPRLGAAWDLFGNGQTVLRGAFGLFYDHPLLAVAFNSDIADASQQQQAVLTPGSPSPTALLNATQVFQGTVCTAAGGNPICPTGVFTPGAAATAKYQFGRQRFNDQTFPGFGTILPFTLPVAKDFQYASAVQGNFSVEQKLGKNMTLTVGYIYVGARHLPHPTDLNTPNTTLQIQNFQRFSGGLLPRSTTEALAGISIASSSPGSSFTNPYGQTCVVVIPGMIAQCPQGRVVNPFIANVFRPSGPNYFLAAALSGGSVTKAVLDSQLGGSLRTPGVISPFGSVNAQISDGNSSYNAMNVELKRRFANNFAFFATYTWSHAIDDSSDLQTLLIAQDVNRFNLEKANSLFDQRHRLVFSGFLSSPQGWRKAESFGKRFFADFTIAPIIEISSGRPFNIITNIDTNNDQSTQTDRPDVTTGGQLCAATLPVSLVPAGAPCSLFDFDKNGNIIFGIGSLGRNMGLTGPYASVDLRVSRGFYFGERIRIDLIAEGFNLFNRFNEAAASPFFGSVNSIGQRRGDKYAGRSTAAYDQRQFQLGIKINF